MNPEFQVSLGLQEDSFCYYSKDFQYFHFYLWRKKTALKIYILKTVKMCVCDKYGFLGLYKGRYCVWRKVPFKATWTPFKITFDIIKFPLGFLSTSAMMWLLRFHKFILTQWLLILTYTVEALTIWPCPSDTLYLPWLCWLNLLNRAEQLFFLEVLIETQTILQVLKIVTIL